MMERSQLETALIPDARKRSIADLDETDRQILDEIQSDFPLDARPFRVVGERIGRPEADVIQRVASMRPAIIRQISAIFDTRRLGYRSSLAAFAFAPHRLERGAQIINRHPGVSHNYQRNHRFNLWFTLAVSPDADLERSIQKLAELSQPDDHVVLQTLRMYKIGVELDMSGSRPITERRAMHTARADWDQVVPLDAKDRATIVELQKDIAIVERPFHAVAEALHISDDELFRGTRELQARGALRRIAAILRHHNAGYAANAMGVWQVPDEARTDELGFQMASF
ncbi:MAG: AsnC family transcriptional regulator, partial [Actinobacteria bacterium]|nr:AsnC family transcriptional regulator [Actinomycetota bacterium]